MVFTGAALSPFAQVVEQTEHDASGIESKDVNTVPEEGIAQPDAHAEPQAVPELNETAQQTVLIVEDTTELAEVIAATLERINIRALHETHVERALDVYYAEHPNVILLDIGLPDKTGWKLLDAIKERDEEERPVVVVITAHGDPANRLMGKLQGVHSYLIKPFTPDEVEVVVGRALAGEPGMTDEASAAGTTTEEA